MDFSLKDFDGSEIHPALKFKNKGLLASALRHSSLKNEEPGWNQADFERLEFLGDAVLNFIISRHIYSAFKESNEGNLSRLRASLVSRATLAKLARELGLERYILTGKSIRRGKPLEDKILADAFEALIAALYLDRGEKQTAAFLLKVYTAYLEDSGVKSAPQDPKSRLQEICQKRWKRLPEYQWIEMAEGVECTVTVNGLSSCAKAETKKKAAVKAAGMMIIRLES